MRKLSKKISMLMVLAMLVGLFSGVVSASAASAWSFKSSKYAVAVNGSINMESNEYADFDLLKDGAAPAGYTVVWASSDEDVVWVNAKTGQLRADKFGKAEDGDSAKISATFTNTATKKSATRSFTIVLGAAKADYTVTAADATIALGEEVKFAPVVKDAAGNTVKFATHKSYNGYFLDGKAITNPWTPEEAGEYTVTVAQFASKADVADLAKAVRKTDVKVTVTVDTAFDAKATGVKEITVYGSFAADAKFTVKKNSNQNVAFTATVAEDGQSAKLALSNRLTKGTYSVAYGDAKVDLTVEDEKVAQIIILEKNGQIFTDGANNAFVHYDVLNQYGESVRKSFNVDWSYNVKSDSDDKTNGILTLTNDEDYDYNDMVVLTGVASGYGYAVSETATMTIGLERDASAVKVLGLVVEESTELLQEIPAGFGGGIYYLVFEMYDRAGYVINYNYTDASEDLKFISLNPLLVEIYEDGAGDPEISSVNIDGRNYGKIRIVKGRDEQVKKGGVAEISITSTKTGTNSPYNLRVVSEQILDEFRIVAPSDIIAENNPDDKNTIAELQYEAVDTNGAPVTDFRALYKAVSFSDESVYLEERNDGTAKLCYSVNRSAVKATEDYDYPVVFTAIVQGTGKSSNMTLNIKADRAATSVAGLVAQNGGCEYILEGNTIAVDLAKNNWNGKPVRIEFNDQYDTLINDVKLFNTGEGKYIAAKLTEEGSTAIKFRTTEKITVDGEEKEVDVDITSKNADGYTLIDPTKALKLMADSNVTSGQKTVAIEFAIADKDGKILGGSDKILTFYVVDINNCVDFAAAPNYPETDALISYKTNSPISYSVTATLTNGKTVAVQNEVAGIYAIKYEAGLQYQDKTITPAAGTALTYVPQEEIAVSGAAAAFKDYSGLNADGSDKVRNLIYSVVTKVLVGDKVKAEMENTFQVGNDWTWQAQIVTKNWGLEVPGWKDVHDNTISAIARPVHSWVTENTDAIVRPTAGMITKADLMVFVEKTLDNYGKDLGAAGINVAVTKLTDGGKGIYAGGPKLGNTALIEMAEIGDTFVATYTDGGAKHSINITVGADTYANFSDSKDICGWR